MHNPNSKPGILLSLNYGAISDLDGDVSSAAHFTVIGPNYKNRVTIPRGFQFKLVDEGKKGGILNNIVPSGKMQPYNHYLTFLISYYITKNKIN